MLTTALVLEADLDESELDELIEDAADLAREWVSARQSESGGT